MHRKMCIRDRDTAIKDGDFQTNGSGLPVRISGARELLQRAVFRLTVKKGSFFYDQQLGSRLYTLKGSYGNREALSETAMQMVREALKPMAEVTPLGVRAGMTGPDQLSLTVSLLADRKQMELEVLI